MIGEVIKKSAGGSILAGVEGQILFGRVESVLPLRMPCLNRETKKHSIPMKTSCMHWKSACRPQEESVTELTVWSCS